MYVNPVIGLCGLLRQYTKSNIYFNNTYFTVLQASTEVAMVGDVFRISLPQSKVSNYFEDKPAVEFYPYFFATEGEFETLQVKSDDEAIGTRQIVVYLPPGNLFL